jgi:hypothetical protein
LITLTKDDRMQMPSSESAFRAFRCGALIAGVALLLGGCAQTTMNDFSHSAAVTQHTPPQPAVAETPTEPVAKKTTKTVATKQPATTTKTATAKTAPVTKTATKTATDPGDDVSPTSAFASGDDPLAKPKPAKKVAPATDTAAKEPAKTPATDDSAAAAPAASAAASGTNDAGQALTDAKGFPNIGVSPNEPKGALLSPEERARVIAELEAMRKRQQGGSAAPAATTAAPAATDKAKSADDACSGADPDATDCAIPLN